MARVFVCVALLSWGSLTWAEDPQTGEMSVRRVSSKLFQHQYSIYDREFCGSEVCMDFDNDGRRELLYVSRMPGRIQMLNAADGSIRWSRELKGQQQSTSAYDLDGDGLIEIVGMTFGGEVYCLDASGSIRWRRDLRPELNDDQHMYMTPILCDLDGDRQLEILAMTHGQYSPTPGLKPNAKLFALDAQGNYVVFGQADAAGIDVLESILDLNVDDPSSGLGGAPLRTVTIDSVTIDEG